MSNYSLSHLKQLEAESIFIIREVAAEFRNPVMLYSIGKDSSVMVQLAMKAFFPAKPPFPLLHVDTTWKFREMIAFRENYARKHLGLEVLVHTNQEGLQDGPAITNTAEFSGRYHQASADREPQGRLRSA